MKYDNLCLNLKLLESVPEIRDVYFEESSWQDGDETGSHVVYADVFVPFIKKQILGKNKSMLIRVFDYIEELLELNDEYADEVVTFSVLESLLFDEEIDNAYFIKFAKKNFLRAINEIIDNLNG